MRPFSGIMMPSISGQGLQAAGHLDLEIGLDQGHAFVPPQVAAVEAEVVVCLLYTSDFSAALFSA